jgi:hypothetical protein
LEHLGDVKAWREGEHLSWNEDLPFDGPVMGRADRSDADRLGATRGNEYHQFASGILVSSVSLLVLLWLVELVWQVLEAILGSRRRV